MDGAIAGLIGGILGTVLGIGGAVIGCWVSYRNARSDGQRAFMRRVFLWLGIGGAVFLGLVVGASTGALPRWVYWAAIAAVFVPMPFAIRWANRRLSELDPNA